MPLSQGGPSSAGNESVSRAGEPPAETIMINNSRIEATDGMTQCTRCGGQLTYNDETTKLVEYACPTCHNTVIVQKESFRARA